MALRQTLLNPSSCSEFSAFVAVKGDTLESNVQFWLEVQKFKVRYMHVFCIINCTFRSRDKWRNVPPFLSVLRELKQRRFWVTHVNRKGAVFSFNMPWRYQICMARCFYAYRDDLTKHLFKITAQECKKSTSVDMRRSKTSLLKLPFIRLVDWIFSFFLTAYFEVC